MNRPRTLLASLASLLFTHLGCAVPMSTDSWQEAGGKGSTATEPNAGSLTHTFRGRVVVDDDQVRWTGTPVTLHGGFQRMELELQAPTTDAAIFASGIYVARSASPVSGMFWGGFTASTVDGKRMTREDPLREGVVMTTTVFVSGVLTMELTTTDHPMGGPYPHIRATMKAPKEWYREQFGEDPPPVSTLVGHGSELLVDEAVGRLASLDVYLGAGPGADGATVENGATYEGSFTARCYVPFRNEPLPCDQPPPPSAFACARLVDSSGEPAPGVSVTSGDGSKTTVSDDRGFLCLDGLEPGDLTLTGPRLSAPCMIGTGSWSEHADNTCVVDGAAVPAKAEEWFCVRLLNGDGSPAPGARMRTTDGLLGGPEEQGPPGLWHLADERGFACADDSLLRSMAQSFEVQDSNGDPQLCRGQSSGDQHVRLGGNELNRCVLEAPSAN